MPDEPQIAYKYLDASLNQPKRILIVDDQGFNIDAIMVILKYSVRVIDVKKICNKAYDGKQALELVKNNIFANGG